MIGEDVDVLILIISLTAEDKDVFYIMSKTKNIFLVRNSENLCPCKTNDSISSRF